MNNSFNEETVWDKTNIGENYPGVTLPLTYSFIKDAYSNVYRGFLGMAGVDKERIGQSDLVLENMLGYVRGNVFYNIENWYGLLKLLPGYGRNKEFFESMLDPSVKKTSLGSTFDMGHLETMKITLFLIYKLIFFGRLHRKFEEKYAFISKSFSGIEFSHLSTFEVISIFETIEKRYLDIWPITVINDFRVMILFGLLKKRAFKYPNLQGEILRGIFDLKNQPRSMLPIKEIIDLASTIRNDDSFRDLFSHDSKDIVSRIGTGPYVRLGEIIKEYLKKYGGRSSNELKLEEPKFRDNPHLFIDLIKYYVFLNDDELSTLSTRVVRKKIEPLFIEIPLLERLVIRNLRKFTTTAVYKREFYRLRRAEVFDIARKVFLELGMRMTEAGDIEESTDIFYLYKNEVFDYVRFHSLKSDFKALIAYRKELLSNYEKRMLSQRVITKGFPSKEQLTDVSAVKHGSSSGMPTSGGRASGQIIVMEKLNLRSEYKGKILVTVATDPGWTVIFPLLRGIITEEGGFFPTPQ
jgi:pyruvate,water dikinase